MNKIIKTIEDKLNEETIKYYRDNLTDNEHETITEEYFNFLINFRRTLEKDYKCTIIISFNMLVNNTFVAWMTNELSKVINHDEYLFLIDEYFYISEDSDIIFGDEADKKYENESLENHAMINAFYKLDPSDCYKA